MGVTGQDLGMVRQADMEKEGWELPQGTFNMMYVGRHGCRGSCKGNCSRIYFVCFSPSACLGENTISSALGLPLTGGCLSMCVFVCVCENVSFSVFMWALRSWASNVKQLGLVWIIHWQSRLQGASLHVAHRLEESMWGCCDRPALCYQWVHRVKSMQIR